MTQESTTLASAHTVLSEAKMPQADLDGTTQDSPTGQVHTGARWASNPMDRGDIEYVVILGEK